MAAAAGVLPRRAAALASAPLLFSLDCLDIGVALGSPVSLDYYDKAPFKFNGTIDQVTVKYKPFAKPAEAAAPSYAATGVAAGSH